MNFLKCRPFEVSNVNTIMRRLWRGLEIFAGTAFFVIAAALLALRFWVLPDIERYRPDIVAAVSRTVGQPVAIGAIEAGWQGWNPRLRLADVRILDAAGREALSLPAVENVLSWRSLLGGELKLHLLAIEAPRLAVRRDAAGDLHVAGMRLAGAAAESDGRLLAWILAQDEIQVRNAEIEWRDELRGAPPLALSALNLRLRNDGREHALGISARPPAALGSALEARVELRSPLALRLAQREQPIANWSGRGFVELGYTDLAGWRPWIDYPLDIRSGHGALRLWTTLQGGRVVGATADVELKSFAARLASELPPLELASVSGRLELERRDGGYDVSGRKLALLPAKGPGMEPTDFRIAWRPAGARPEQGSFGAKVLDLQPLAALAAALPLPGALRARLAELAPRGQLLDARLDWTGDLEEPQALSGQTRFTGLAMKARGEAPGFEGLSGSLEGTDARVAVTLAARKAALEVPQVFPEPRLLFERLDGQLVWERRGEGYAVRVGSLSFANEHLEGRASGQYANPGTGPGTVDFTADVMRADASQVRRYLPRGELMGPRTRAYLAEAIREGEGIDAKLRLRGDLAHFPFKDPALGEFQVTAHVRKGRFAVGNGWPDIEDIDASLLFERDRMEITGRSARVLGTHLAGVKVEIPAFRVPEIHLLASGQADGAPAEFLRFVAATPARERIGRFTDGMAAGPGTGRLNVRMDLPLEGEEATRMEGEFRFAANTLAVSPELPPIERATARISFTESAVELREGRGRLFGGSLAVGGGTRSGGLEFTAKGDATVAALQELVAHPIARSFSGAASYAALVSVQDGRARIGIESTLRGVASALPPPFAKRPADALPLRIHLASAEGGRDRISVALGALARAELLRGPVDGAKSVQRAAVWLSPQGTGPVRVPERPGLLVYGVLDAVELDAWMALLGPSQASGETPPPPASPWPTVLDLKVGVLEAYGKRVHDLTVRAGVDAAGWSASLNAREAAGEVSYRHEGAGLLVARLERLEIPESATPARGAAKAQERDLPAVDVIAEQFSYHQRALGRLELVAAHEKSDWRIDKLVLLNPEGAITGKGRWSGAGAVPRAGGAASRTSLDLELAASDAGRLLERFGYPDLVRGGEARMQADLAWEGEPTRIDYATLSGNVQLQAGNGQFLEIEPGIGKLISLMSLQALPRRLTLDFRDVFSKGFRFDRIASSASIRQGVLALNDFEMEGSAAKVFMSGQVDLARETQDLSVRVMPALGDTASTVIAILNPLLLFPAAIAQRILKDPLGHIFAFHYSISGSWADPKVERTGVNAEPIEGAKQP
jgi:uncharacterized protein (TIGR02099 family)